MGRHARQIGSKSTAHLRFQKLQQKNLEKSYLQQIKVLICISQLIHSICEMYDGFKKIWTVESKIYEPVQHT